MLKVSKNDCSGCSACAQICTRNAINMVDDKEGFLYPIIDQNKCIKCGLCNAVCPITSTITENSGDTQHCYVATTENSHYYMDSASIGICTMLSKYILSKNGCVFGVYLDESDWTVYHIAVEKEEDLNKIRYSGDGINYNLRPSCYSCHFRSEKRYGDVTVGDPWFINDKTIKNPNLTSRNFIRSLYSVNTEKGVELAANIKDFLIEEELKLTDAFCQPALKKGNRQIPEKRSQLFANLDTEEYGSLVERLLDCDLEKAHQVFNRKYRICRIKKTIKSLLYK